MKLKEFTAEQVRALDEFEIIDGKIVVKSGFGNFRAKELPPYAMSLLESGVAPADHKQLAEIYGKDARDLLLGNAATKIIPSREGDHEHDVTWALVDGKVEIQSVGGFGTPHTEYNGSTDYSSSTDAALRFGGAQTWACEVFIPASQAGVALVILDGHIGADGIYIFKWTDGQIMFDTNVPGLTNRLQTPFAGNYDSWAKIVCMNDGVNSSLYINGSLIGSVAAVPLESTATTVNIGARNNDFVRKFNGNIRNIEIYNAGAITPAEWIPGNINSMGIAGGLVLQSKDGSGTDNEQGLTFTVTGSPVTGSDNPHTHTFALKSGKAGGISGALNNLIATTDPSVGGGDDEAAGYLAGVSIWMNTTSGEVFRFLGDSADWVQGPSFDLSDLAGAVGNTQLVAAIEASIAKADAAAQQRPTDEIASSLTTKVAGIGFGAFVITMSAAENFSLGLGAVATYPGTLRAARLGVGTGTLTLVADGTETILDTRDNTEAASVTIDVQGSSVELTRITDKWVLR